MLLVLQFYSFYLALFFSFSFFSFIFAEAVDRTGEDFIIKTGITKFKQIFFKFNKFFVAVFSKKILRFFKFGMLLSDGKTGKKKTPIFNV